MKKETDLEEDFSKEDVEKIEKNKKGRKKIVMKGQVWMRCMLTLSSGHPYHP